MELTERFVVPASVERVWSLFDDVPKVVTCMPGAQVTERIDERTYRAQLTLAVGPIRPKFDVRAEIERNDAEHEGHINVHAVDKRGGSQARGQITYRVSETGDGGSAAIELNQQVTLSGPLAQFGRTGVIEDINAQMTKQFAECLAAQLADKTDEAEIADQHVFSAGGSMQEPTRSAEPVASGEIRILPLLTKTLFKRFLKALRIRN